ncbi:hypothetical protein [Microvirga sp. P5_D2]
MGGKRSDDDKGLAEQSLGTSNVPPTDANPHRQDQGDGSSGGRQLRKNDQRKGMEKAGHGKS